MKPHAPQHALGLVYIVFILAGLLWITYLSKRMSSQSAHPSKPAQPDSRCSTSAGANTHAEASSRPRNLRGAQLRGKVTMGPVLDTFGLA